MQKFKVTAQHIESMYMRRIQALKDPQNLNNLKNLFVCGGYTPEKIKEILYSVILFNCEIYDNRSYGTISNRKNDFLYFMDRQILDVSAYGNNTNWLDFINDIFRPLGVTITLEELWERRNTLLRLPERERLRKIGFNSGEMNMLRRPNNPIEISHPEILKLIFLTEASLYGDLTGDYCDTALISLSKDNVYGIPVEKKPKEKKPKQKKVRKAAVVKYNNLENTILNSGTPHVAKSFAELYEIIMDNEEDFEGRFVDNNDGSVTLTDIPLSFVRSKYGLTAKDGDQPYVYIFFGPIPDEEIYRPDWDDAFMTVAKKYVYNNEIRPDYKFTMDSIKGARLTYYDMSPCGLDYWMRNPACRFFSDMEARKEPTDYIRTKGTLTVFASGKVNYHSEDYEYEVEDDPAVVINEDYAVSPNFTEEE